MPQTSTAQTDLKKSLTHILWMGGSPCSGKTSVARILTGEYGLRSYHCDEAFAEHQQRITPGRQPMLTKWTRTAWNELWMQTPKILVAEAIACYQEHFQLVVTDLLSLPQPEPMLVEGTCLLPGSVHTVLSSRSAAVWMVPTERFQKAHYAGRGPWVQAILNECAKPEQAYQNWMGRDVAFARWVTSTADELGLRTVPIDGSRTIAENARLVADHFGL
jgi:2-phosphoglycerate kinase